MVSSTGTVSSKRWMKYTSIQSVPSRRSEASHCSRIAARDRPAAGRPVMHAPDDLRRQDDILAAGVASDRPTDELLRRPSLVDVRGVPQRDPEFDRLTEERLRRVLVQASTSADRPSVRRNSCSRAQCG